MPESVNGDGGWGVKVGVCGLGLSPVGVVCGIVGVMVAGLSVGEAFEKWGEDLTRYATVVVGAVDAADVVQQAFVDVVWSGRWDQVRDPRAYLFRVTLNAARAMRRSEGRRAAREWRTASDDVVSFELLGDPAVVAAVKQLSLQQRAVVFLAYWEDLTPGQIAEVLGVGDGTVRRQLARARARLRGVLT